MELTWKSAGWHHDLAMHPSVAKTLTRFSFLPKHLTHDMLEPKLMQRDLFSQPFDILTSFDSAIRHAIKTKLIGTGIALHKTAAHANLFDHVIHLQVRAKMSYLSESASLQLATKVSMPEFS